MSSIPQKDRVSLCRYTFSDHRQCRTPRSPHHPHFCFYHARLESQSAAAAELAGDIAFFFSGEYISANDLSRVLSRILPAIIRGDIKPRLAKTIVYLAQTLNQTIQLSQHEYVNAYGGDAWRRIIHSNISQNAERGNPPSKSENNAASEEQQPEPPQEQSASKPERNSAPHQNESQNPLPLRNQALPAHESPKKDQREVDLNEVALNEADLNEVELIESDLKKVERQDKHKFEAVKSRQHPVAQTFSL
jgi:hypothetical protein